MFFIFGMFEYNNVNATEIQDKSIKKNTISPFSNLEWDDNILDVISKMNSQYKFQTAIVSMTSANMTNVKDLVDRAQIKDELTKSIIKYMERDDRPEQYTKYHNKLILTSMDNSNSINFTKGNLGAGSQAIITFENIVINGLDYTLKITFTGHIGAFGAFPNKAVSFVIRDKEYFFPAYMSEVSLRCNKGSGMSKEQSYLLTEMLYKKYNTFLKEPEKCWYKDKEGNKKLLCDNYYDKYNHRVVQVNLGHTIIYDYRSFGWITNAFHKIDEEYDTNANSSKNDSGNQL